MPGKFKDLNPQSNQALDLWSKYQDNILKYMDEISEEVFDKLGCQKKYEGLSGIYQSYPRINKPNICYEYPRGIIVVCTASATQFRMVVEKSSFPHQLYQWDFIPDFLDIYFRQAVKCLVG